MNAHEWFAENRVGFVARTLEPDEHRAFLDHLQRCAECRAEVGQIERELAWLPMGVRPVPPRPGLKRELAERVLARRRGRWPWLPAAVAAALVLAAGLAFAGYRKVDTLRTALAAIQDTLSIIRRANRVLQASITMDGHEGGITIFADAATHRWNVVVHGLPPADPGAVYQFWFICEDGMVRGAPVQLTGSGTAILTLGMPATGGKVMGAALTVEPMDNTSSGPKGKELAHLML